MTTKLKHLKNELEQILSAHKAIEKVKHDEIRAEEARIWLANTAKKKRSTKDVEFITRALSANLRVGDFVKVTGARSGPYRRVIETGDGYNYGNGKWMPGGMHAQVIRVQGKDKVPYTSALHDIRYCGIDKVSHVWVNDKWMKAVDYAERSREPKSD